MSCDCGKKKNNTCGMTPEVVEIINEECPVLFHKVTISADRGDDSPESPVAPTNGTYRNALVVYEATNHKYIYSSDGIYTRIDNDAKMFNELLGRPKYNGEEMTNETDIPSVEQLREDMERADEALGDRIDDTNASVVAEREARAAAIQAEATARDNADQALSAQITDLSGDIEAEAEARRAADLGLSQDIIQEANTRSQNDARIDAALAEEATTRGIEDATIRAELEQEVQDRQDAIDDVQAELNRNYVNDLEMEANASSVTFIEDKINPVTGVTSQERDVIPTASATTAGTMSAAEFNSITDSQEKIEALLGGAVAITGLPASPTQAQLTAAWKQETGRDELINRASIYDVTNEKVWTYYTNVTTWEPVDAHGSVSVAQFTNGQLGTIKGSTLAGNVSANADGTGSVSGWSNLVDSVAGKASQNDMAQAQTDITNIQGDITTINTTLAGKANIADVPTKTSELTNDTNYVSDSNYVHTDNNFTTVEKTNVANNTAAVSSMQPKVTKLDDTAVRLVADKTIPNNADLNTLEYLAVGNYVCSTNTGAQSLSNCPTDQAFRMEVYNATSTTYDDETTGTWRYRWRKITNLSGTSWYQSANSGSTAGQWTYYDWIQVPKMTDLPTRTSQLTNDTDNSASQAEIIHEVFVDCVNGNDNNAGTNAAPFKTLTAAFKAIGQGRKHSTITFKSNGSYDLTADLSSAVWLEGCYSYWNFASGVTDVTVNNLKTLRLEDSSIVVGGSGSTTLKFAKWVEAYNSYLQFSSQVVADAGMELHGSSLWAFNTFSVYGGRLATYAGSTVRICGGTFANTLNDEVIHGEQSDIVFWSDSSINKLIPVPKSGGNYGITASYDSATGLISLTGTGTETWANPIYDQAISLPAGTYTFSIDRTIALRVYIKFLDGMTPLTDARIDPGSKTATVTLSQAATSVRLWFSDTSGTVTDGTQFRAMLQSGSSASSWQNPQRNTYIINDENHTGTNIGSIYLIDCNTRFYNEPKFSVINSADKVIRLNQGTVYNYWQLEESGLASNKIMLNNCEVDYTGTQTSGVLNGNRADDGSREWEQFDSVKTYVDARGSVKMKDTYSALVPDTRIPANSDLNSVTYLYPGRYYIASYNDATTIAHVPVTAAMMIETLVPCSTTYGDESTNAWLIRLQRAQDGNGRVFYRYISTGGTAGQYTYGDWKKLATTDEAGGDVRIGDVLSQPNDVAYVDTQNLIDEAVTASKIDFSTMEPVVLYSTSSTSSAGTSQTLNWTELADDIDNYRFLIINFMSPQSNYTSGLRDNIIRAAGLKTGRTVDLQNFGWGSGANAQFEWARLDTNSTGLTVSYAGVLRTGSGQGPNTAQTYTQQPVRIRAIYGIK